MQSVLVEGGGAVLRAFLATDLWQQLDIYQTTTVFGTGVAGNEQRAQVGAIIVGSETALTDTPSLTVRHTSMTHPQPLRVILDRRGRLQSESQFFDDRTLIYTMNEALLRDAGIAVDVLNQSVSEKLNPSFHHFFETGHPYVMLKVAQSADGYITKVVGQSTKITDASADVATLAEVDAMQQVPNSADLKDATMYVTLEPCAHIGKVGACADAIVAAGIGRVVVGQGDPNPLVHGQGISIHHHAGFLFPE
ncbi:dihydrofolate reductase family protein [Weissella confusa]|uniref:Riboflavin biosynthesis protein RibD n=1 Tax=Weissella confusa TaxID=1583 RepID=A0A923NFC8_WEICO|nr:dihydrofolate reductase family protein [Weissella confusa]